MKRKNVFRLMAIMLAAVLAVGFVACGDDDDDGDKGNGTSSSTTDGNGTTGGNVNSGLVGMWRRIYKNEVEYMQENGEWKVIKEDEKTYEDDDSSQGFIFKADNSAQLIYATADGTYELETDDAFKWKIENNRLYLLEDEPEDTDGWESWGTIVLSGNTFELTEEGTSHHGTSKKHKVTRYKKVS